MRFSILLFVAVLLLAACGEVEPGNYYLVPAGTITPDYSYEGWAVKLVTVLPTATPYPTQTRYPTHTPYPTQTRYPTYTPGFPEPTVDVATQPPTKLPLPKCEVRAGSGIPYYAQPNTAGGALGLLGEGITYQPQVVLSTNNNIWAYIVGKGYVPDMVGFRIFDNEACRDLLQSVNTPVPTSSAPTPTPIGKIYACTNTGSFINIRTGPGTSYTIVGTLNVGQKVEIVTKLDTGWWEVWYGSLPGQYIAGWLAREC